MQISYSGRRERQEAAGVFFVFMDNESSNNILTIDVITLCLGTAAS